MNKRKLLFSDKVCLSPRRLPGRTSLQWQRPICARCAISPPLPNTAASRVQRGNCTSPSRRSASRSRRSSNCSASPSSSAARGGQAHARGRCFPGRLQAGRCPCRPLGPTRAGRRPRRGRNPAIIYTLVSAFETVPLLLARLDQESPQLEVDAREVFGCDVADLPRDGDCDLALAPMTSHPEDIRQRTVGARSCESPSRTPSPRRPRRDRALQPARRDAGAVAA